MSKVFTVNGIEVPLEEDIFNLIRDKFKKDVDIGDCSVKNLEVYFLIEIYEI